MSTNTVVAPVLAPTADGRSAHRFRLAVGYALAIALIVTLAVYGYDYYTLGTVNRPFSPKHALLRPSGRIGLKLGFLGLAMFLAIFLYPLRKRWAWLARQGSSKHWLDIHVLLGLAAPFVIAFHASFKFSGFAGMAFWIMLAVSISGVVGRYLYAQIPRSLNTAELSLREAQDLRERLASQLTSQRVLPPADWQSLMRLPTPETAEKLPMVAALVYMMVLDLIRPMRAASMRRHRLGAGEILASLGGFLPTRHVDLERAISLARQEAALAKRILFLSRSRQVFHLWHVVHKPFSYSFALLALIHIGVVFMMGFF
jgi:hypothetical protein